jgi:hypothetical protein
MLKRLKDKNIQATLESMDGPEALALPTARKWR